MGPTTPTGSVYHRSYAPLKQPIINSAWRMLTVFVSFFSVLQTLPWQTVKAVAPGGMKNTMIEIENTVLGYLIPFCNFWQDAWYKLFTVADGVACSLHANVLHFSRRFSHDVGNLSNRVLVILENRASVLQDFGIFAFPILFQAGLFTPNAMTAVPGMAVGAAKGAAQGLTNRVAQMGAPISPNPAGATNAAVTQALNSGY